MTIIELEEFDDDRSTYLKSLVEQTEEFDRMEEYFTRLGGDIEKADFAARHIKGDETGGISVSYVSKTDKQDELELKFDVMINDNTLDYITGTIRIDGNKSTI